MRMLFPQIILSRRPELGVRISSYVMEFDVFNADLKTKAYTLLDYCRDIKGWTITHQVPNPDRREQHLFCCKDLSEKTG
jgi:hypothetical protein